MEWHLCQYIAASLSPVVVVQSFAACVASVRLPGGVLSETDAGLAYRCMLYFILHYDREGLSKLWTAIAAVSRRSVDKAALVGIAAGDALLLQDDDCRGGLLSWWSASVISTCNKRAKLCSVGRFLLTSLRAVV